MRNVMRGGVMRGGVMLGGVMRSQRGGFDPLSLFSAGQQGAWYEPADLSTLFLERTSPATTASVGDPVGTMLDKSPNANHATAPSDAARPILRQTPGRLYYLDFDGVDDSLFADGLGAMLSGEDIPVSVGMAVSVGGTVGKVVYGWTNSLSSAPLIEAQHNQDVQESRPHQRRDDASVLKNSIITQDLSSVSVIGIEDTGTLVELFNNNVSQGSLDRDVGQITLDSFTIGATRRGGPTSLHSVMNLYGLIINEPVSNNEREERDKYLATKSGVTL